MRRTMLLLVAAAMSITSSAQDYGDQHIETLFDNDGPVAHGGYGALTLKYGKILDQDAWFTGIRGGWLIDHRFTLGIAGAGLVSRVVNDDWLPEDPSPDLEARLLTGYGGLLLEPIIFYRAPFHISAPVVFGAGGATYGLQDGSFWSDPDINFEDDAVAFFVFEPGLEIEINALRFMRINVGASYFYTSDVRLPEVETDFMRGFRGTFTLKFGAF